MKKVNPVILFFTVWFCVAIFIVASEIIQKFL